MKRNAVTRLLTLLTAFCLALALFGCAPKTDDSQPSSEPASTAQTPERSDSDTTKEPAVTPEPQPAAEENKEELTEEAAVAEKAKEQLEVIQEQAAQLEANSEEGENTELQEELNKAADELDVHLQEELAGDSN